LRTAILERLDHAAYLAAQEEEEKTRQAVISRLGMDDGGTQPVHQRETIDPHIRHSRPASL
jgi:hypothetical protein